MNRNIDKQRNIATAYWNIFRRNADIRQSDDKAWSDVVTEMDAVCRKYIDTPLESFARKMYLAFMSEIERLSKAR